MPRRATALCVLGSFLCALPGSPALAADVEGAEVLHGSADIKVDGGTTTITTGTRETIVEYDRFGVAKGNLLQIDQPDAGSKIMNRVRREGEASRIDGTLKSNGIVLILNPAGVFFGEHALVDVAELVAGAGALSNQDFLSGVDRFTDLEGEIGVERGAVLRASGDIALLGRRVENLGSVLSQHGSVAIVAGGTVRLAKLDGHISVQVDAGPELAPGADYALTQGGHVEGQRVTLAVGDHYSLAMNHTGVTRAEEIHVEAGPEGRVELAGTLDASNQGPGGTGGSIRVQAGEIAVDHATLDASGASGGGEILLGGDLRGGGEMPVARRLQVGPDSLLVADARQAGDGGKIILYSVERTAFLGALSAQGGAEGGDGGFAEISGAKLVAAGAVDLGAERGESGTLLYDPDVVEIRGGSGTPTDDGVTSVLFENGLETTNANIVIEAVNQIFASGDFVGDAVVIMPGNDLTLRTTRTSPDGAPANLGIDLVTQTAEFASGDVLSWEVSQGANLTLETQLGTLGTPTATGAKASIVAGRLVANGAAFESNPDLTVMVPDTQNPQGVAVRTNRGDIDVTAIESNGDDSRVGFTTSAGGQVIVATAQGDISIGSVSAQGGDSVAGALSPSGQRMALEASPGGNGGSVTLDAGSDTEVGFGSLTVESVDVSGGEGRGDLLTLPDDEGERQVAIAARGGDGGGMSLSAAGEDGADGGGKVSVTGDLLATGGAGIAVEGFEVEGEDSLIDAARGGEGGLIAITARGGVAIAPNEALEQVVLDASGGDGSSSGGNAVSDVAPFGEETEAISIVDDDAGDPGGDVVIDAQLIARGGNARVSGEPTIDVALLEGGSGGFGGDITIAAEDGAIDSETLSVDASGGEGNGRTDPETGEVPLSTTGVVLFAGGSARTLTLQADTALEVGQLTLRGGLGVNANGGQGAAGGVNVRSDAGVVTVHGIDTSGGDAELGAGASEGVAINGGRAGSISVLAPGTETTTGGVALAGLLLARGGTGMDAEGAATRSNVGNVSISTDGAVDAVDSDALVQGHVVQISADDSIGTGGPVSIAGTGFEDPVSGLPTDRAVLSVSGNLHADVRTELDSEAFGSVEIQQLDATGSAELESDGDSILHADNTSGTHTLTRLGRGDANDPALIYRLDVTLAQGQTEQPALAIGQDALDLGGAGGEIANGRTDSSGGPVNRGAIVAAAGSTAHGSTDGNLRLTGSTIGAPGAPIRVNGGGDDSALRIDAQGGVHGSVGTAFAAIDVLQRKADAGTDIDLTGDGVSEIDVDAGGTTAAPVQRIERADTTGSDSGFSYRLLEVATPGAGNARLEVDEMRLGGSGRLVARGDVVLLDDAGTAIDTNGHALALESNAGAISQEGDGVSVDMSGPSPADEQAQLVLLASAGVGTSAAPLRTAGVEHLAGSTTTGSFVLDNQGAGEGPLRIERVTPLDPAAVGNDRTTLATVAGVAAFGEDPGVEVDITQRGTPLVLGDITDGAQFTGTHVFSRGDLALRADAGIQIENARYLRVQVPLLPDTFVPLNDARMAAFGDLVLEAPSIRTSEASVATSDEVGAPGPAFVHGSLELESAGTVRFIGGTEGDVGGDGSNPDHQLALLDTTRAAVEGERTFRVADARFRGTLDGPGGVTLIAQDASSSQPSPEGHVATALFEGNIGTGGQLTRFDVQGEKIVFTSADRIVTGTGGVHLSTNQAPGVIPQAATIEDRNGGLRIQTAGEFRTGDADSFDKLSVAGPLAIQAASVRAGDLNAARSLTVDSPDIAILARAAAPIELRNGDTPDDAGTDWVADRISLSSVPTIEGTGSGVVTLGVGGGGVSAPGSLSAFEVRRYTRGVDAVETGDLFASDGRMLDLTATGDRVVGNPSADLPRERPTTTPSMPPELSDTQPAPAPLVDAEQLLAYLRCGEPDSLSACDAADAALLAGVEDFPESALGTPRAEELATSWRALRSRDLSGAFDAAGAGYRAQSGFGELDGASFGTYLETTREHMDARAALHQLASILVEVEMLSLAPEDETRVRRQLAGDFAAEADVPGFDTDAVLAAIEATPIGLPGE